MLAGLVFYLAFATLLAHEMDAVHKREWRLLYVLRGMDERLARRAFVVVHVPLVALTLWLVVYPGEPVRFWTAAALDLFMIVHAGLHWRLEGHPEYRFTSGLSWSLIYGAAALALVHLLLSALLR